ncbi:hypothetical protein DFH07DRAFT_1005474 [Mycena maculata]|uniref:C3H1-type domain-containing protein n=1 Tax=Mycena maculata TaxID=230809 RepID=A0AAD7HMP3_9AGAR|nr:hypothetical protein DFH07DRAFT_1005474 [Mycena maculata]
MPSAERSASPDDREKDDGRGGGKKGAASKAKDLSHVPCKFYKVGSCTAGSSCPFSHSLAEPGGQKDVCAWFVKGNCKFGHKCALAHVLPGQTMAMDRKNKKAAQIAAGGSKREGGEGGKGRGGSKREGGGRNGSGLLAGGSTAPTRARPPMNMPLKATISPSAPAPPLKDTDFASFGVLDEASQLPSAPARNKSPDLPPSINASTNTSGGKPPSPTLPVSAPRRPSMGSASPSKDFGPIGSPPSGATSLNARMHSGTPPTQNGFLSTSPFSAPGTQSVFLGYNDGARKNMGMAASLGSGMAMAGPWSGNGTASSPHRGSLLSASRTRDVFDADDNGTSGGRKIIREDSGEDLEDFLPGSLTDLLTPEERSRRMSRTASAESRGLGVPANPSANPSGSGHRYSRSVPAPSLLGGDLKNIWAQDPAHPSHPTSAGLPGSPLHGSFGAATPSSSFVDERGLGMRGLSPSNASAAFLPGIHQYIAQNKRQLSTQNSAQNLHPGANGVNGVNGLSSGNSFAPNAAHQQGPPGLAHYLTAGPSGLSTPNANNNNNNNNNGQGVNSYVRPNPFDLTQAMHAHQQQQQQQHQTLQHGAPNLPPGLGLGGEHAHGGAGMGDRMHSGERIPGLGLGDTHILSPNARALQAHAPGQSLPQGLAAGYSRIHALPPVSGVSGSPSPAFGGVGSPSYNQFGSPGVGGGNSVAVGGAYSGRDWSTMSAGSVGGSASPSMSGFLATLSAAAAASANNNNNNAQGGGQQQPTHQAKSPSQGAGLDAMFSRLSYSAAASQAPQVQRSTSGGGGWRQQAPLSPLSGPVLTREGAAGDEDDLFPLDE